MRERWLVPLLSAAASAFAASCVSLPPKELPDQVRLCVYGDRDVEPLLDAWSEQGIQTKITVRTSNFQNTDWYRTPVFTEICDHRIVFQPYDAYDYLMLPFAIGFGYTIAYTDESGAELPGKTAIVINDFGLVHEGWHLLQDEMGHSLTLDANSYSADIEQSLVDH